MVLLFAPHDSCFLTTAIIQIAAGACHLLVGKAHRRSLRIGDGALCRPERHHVATIAHWLVGLHIAQVAAVRVHCLLIHPVGRLSLVLMEILFHVCLLNQFIYNAI